MFCFVLLLSVQDSFSQVKATGTINGVVIDWNGAVFPSATVKAELKSSGKDIYIKTTSSDVHGKFSFENLPMGIYVISSEFYGMSYKNDNVKLDTSESVSLAVRLTYGGECENSEGRTIELTETEKAFIINEVLETSLEKKNIPDYGLLKKQKGKIILSTENIKSGC